MKRIAPTCSNCKVKKRWQKTNADSPDDGFVIIVSRVTVWVCPKCGDTSFKPKVTAMLIDTFRELSAAMKKACTRGQKVTELVVKVA